MSAKWGTGIILFVLIPWLGSLGMADADLILHHGKVVTVDDKFSIREAMAVEKGKFWPSDLTRKF